MNLTKEQLKQAVLGLIMVLLALYVYFASLLSPLATKEASAIREMAALEPKIKGVRSQLSRTRAIEMGDPHKEYTDAVRKTINEQIPQEAAIVWLPQQVSDRFRMNGVENVSVISKGASPDLELENLNLSQWEVRVPSTTYHQFGESIVALENHLGLGQITSLQIDSLADKPGEQTIAFSFSTVTRP